MVEEEQLPVRLQLTAGNEDTTDVTGLDTDENGPNTVTNVIVGTFSSSLRASPATTGRWAYSFLPVLDGTQVLKTDGGNLTSQGANVLFALSGGMLIGYVDVGAAGYVDGIDRQVFTVELNPPADGQYRFTLLDNLDHLRGPDQPPHGRDTLQTVDVQLIVDISGSMGDDVGDVPDFSGQPHVVSQNSSPDC